MAGVRRLLVLLALAVVGADSYRVLMLAPTGGKSQKHVLGGLAEALAESGHQVVLLSAFRSPTPVPGVEEVVPDALAAVSTDDKYPNMFQMSKQGVQAGWKQIQAHLSDGPRAALTSIELRNILRRKDFDVVIFGASAYSLYFVPLLLKKPFIIMVPVPYMPMLTGPLGNPTIPAIHPNLYTTSSVDRMTFLERTKNVIDHVFMDIFRRVYSWYCDRLVSETFDWKKIGREAPPSALEIERNASLILINSSPAMNYPKPLLPNAIEVGGVHCTRARPLPQELVRFIGDAEFVYFSMGSIARPKDMTSEQRSAILEALGALPYKVLLKWDTTERAGIPRNVLPSRWLPQQDLLASGRCRLFVTHGGYASLVESVCHAVPMLVLPVSLDQHANAASAEAMGLASVLPWEKLTRAALTSALDAALSPEHRTAALRRRDLLQSQPVSPRQLAVHWVEHVARHGGSPHLRSVGADLSFFQYYSLDVLVFLLAVLLLVLWLMVTALKCFWRCACGKRPGVTPAKVTDGGSRAKRDGGSRAKRDGGEKRVKRE